MTSLILRTSTPFLAPLLFIVSLFLLFRGHNQPGGGFVGGLIAASSFALYVIAFNVQHARRRLGIDPHILTGLGLVIALSSGMVSLIQGEPFMTGQWVDIEVPWLGHLELSTPLVFDMGVYFVVLGVLMLIILSLAEE